MKPRSRRRLSALSLPVSLTLWVAGCGLAGPGEDPGRVHGDPVLQASSTAACDLPAARDAVALFATEGGVTLAMGPGAERAAGADQGEGAVARRYEGASCALTPDGSAAVAVHQLLDADERGGIYAFPRATSEPGVLSTLAPGSFRGYSDGEVVRVDREGRVSQVVVAPRGIWTFGTSPGGGAFWSSSCGPTGIFVTGSAPPRAVMEAPPTRWSDGGVLTDDRTLWSIGGGQVLVRSTAEGSRELASAAVDLGAGAEGTHLVRCGQRVCGVAEAAGSSRGVYALLRGESGGRLVYTPLR